ncbi:MAG: DUF3991 domain-containing protein [Verrucomicrobiales bacterium]|nr:DUF3991 domain-containing protein [Verrucomicrobiales bacterium]
MNPPPVVQHWPRVERYLTQERQLPGSLLAPLVRSGLLYADARGNAVFLLGETPLTAVGAELLGTTPQSWRGMAPGSRKDRGFFSVSATSPQAIALCESAIDALSCHVLYPTHLRVCCQRICQQRSYHPVNVGGSGVRPNSLARKREMPDFKGRSEC